MTLTATAPKPALCALRAIWDRLRRHCLRCASGNQTVCLHGVNAEFGVIGTWQV